MPFRFDRRPLPALLLPLAAACVNTPPKDEPDGTLPPPFTAEEIQAANPPGTVLVFRVEQPDEPDVRRTMRFVADDGERATIEGSMHLAATGEELVPSKTQTQAWTQLREHASFQAGSATRSRTTVEVAAGTFDAWLYVVFAEDPRSGARQVQRYYFALDQPGPPVLFETEDERGVTYRMELQEQLHADASSAAHE